MLIYCEMITTVELMLPHPTIYCFLFEVKTFTIYSLSNLQVYINNIMVLLTIVTMLCIRSLGKSLLRRGGLCPLLDISPFLPPSATGNHHFTPCPF